jgi:murein DD-endopeptidase MepM/ murein hydrolase activator NlpD
MKRLFSILSSCRLQVNLVKRRILSIGKIGSKIIKKVIGTNLTLMFIATSFVPGNTTISTGTPSESYEIKEIDTPIITIKVFQYPLANMRISQSFSFFHPGVDLAVPIGTPIKSVKEGKVVEAGYSPLGYGKMVYIDHGNGVTSLYGHMSKILVKNGDEVDNNTIIGEIGSTGHSTGPHLHLEIRIGEKPINPFSVLPLPNISE